MVSEPTAPKITLEEAVRRTLAGEIDEDLSDVIGSYPDEEVNAMAEKIKAEQNGPTDGEAGGAVTPEAATPKITLEEAVRRHLSGEIDEDVNDVLMSYPDDEVNAMAEKVKAEQNGPTDGEAGGAVTPEATAPKITLEEAVRRTLDGEIDEDVDNVRNDYSDEEINAMEAKVKAEQNGPTDGEAGGTYKATTSKMTLDEAVRRDLSGEIDEDVNDAILSYPDEEINAMYAKVKAEVEAAIRRRTAGNTNEGDQFLLSNIDPSIIESIQVKLNADYHKHKNNNAQDNASGPLFGSPSTTNAIESANNGNVGFGTKTLIAMKKWLFSYTVIIALIAIPTWLYTRHKSTEKEVQRTSQRNQGEIEKQQIALVRTLYTTYPDIHFFDSIVAPPHAVAEYTIDKQKRFSQYPMVILRDWYLADIMRNDSSAFFTIYLYDSDEIETIFEIKTKSTEADIFYSKMLGTDSTFIDRNGNMTMGHTWLIIAVENLDKTSLKLQAEFDTPDGEADASAYSVSFNGFAPTVIRAKAVDVIRPPLLGD